MNSDIIIRLATREDTAIIARAIAMAVGHDAAFNYCGKDYLVVLAEIADTENTQYCWRNALIAEVGGVTAGAVVGYDGARLEQLREGTYSVLRKHFGQAPDIPDETEQGEFYLDSLGVLPEFRGQGAGRALLVALCNRAFAEGHERVGLIVDYDNPRAEALYKSLGFRRVGTRLFFGHKMWHLQKER